MDKIYQSVLQHPHDAYFEQVFKIIPVVKQLIKQRIPATQLALLDLDTLELSTESFVNDDLKESFSDLIYTCKTKGGEESVRICLLFEHKSQSTGRKIYIQLLRYLLGIQSEDLSQERPVFTLSIPILFYHGKSEWVPGPLREQYGAVPAELKGYIPHFDLIFISLRDMSDEALFAMQDSLLLRNIFLTLKHAKDDNFFRQHYQKVFIFADENVSEENLLLLFKSTFLYVQIVSSLTKEEIMQMVQTLPPQYERTAKSTYEQFVEEGIEKGMKQGIEKGMKQGMEKGRAEGREEGREEGMENIILNLMSNRPTLTDQEIADMLGVRLQLVVQVRKKL